MSSPPRTASPPPAAPSAGTARWLNVVTTTVLGAVVLVVVAAAAPSLLRAGLHAADEPQGFPPPVRAPRPAFVPRDHLPHAFPMPDAPPLDDDEPPRPRAVSPNDPLAAPPRLPGQDREDDDEADLGLKGGITLKPLLLRDRRTGTVLHEVKPGESVAILHEDGDWLLVVHKREGELTTGWAKRSELLLR